MTDVEGQLPQGLVGTLYRNGPGTHDWTDSFFDGDGLIRAIRIGEDGSVRYQAKYVETPKYLAERAAKRQLYRLAGTNRPGGILTNMFRPPAHEANTSVVQMADRLWALEEGGHPYEIDPETLATGEMTDFDGQLKARTAFTAHPHVDPDTGDTFGFGMHFGAKPSLKLFRVDRSTRLHSVGDIPVEGNTVYVDANYGGGDGTGSAAKFKRSRPRRVHSRSASSLASAENSLNVW